MIIYKITNLVNGKVYIGQTVQKNPKMRWYDHNAKVRTGVINPLYCSMRKHGADKFSWEVIDTATSLEQLNELEVKWLAHYRALGLVYNNREAGGNKIHSAQSIEKMRAAQKKRHQEKPAGGWTRIDGGAMKGKPHPAKGTKRPNTMTTEVKEHLRQLKLEATYCRGKSWTVVNGKRVWVEKV